MEHWIGIVGVVVLMLIAVALSEDRRRFPLRIAVAGTLLQLAMALLLLKAPGVATVFDVLARGVNGVIIQADAGIAFVFGDKLAQAQEPLGFVFAVKVLPVIIFFASLMGVLYHLGVMQRIVSGLAWLLRGTMGVTGSEALCMAANVFLGQTEAPLCIKPYLATMTRSQMATVMTGGYATIAGSVMAAYVNMLGGQDEALRLLYIKHLLTASLMAAPAAFVMSRIIVPERETPVDENARAADAVPAANIFDAAAAGATDGLKLAANVAAMLIAFTALLSLVNWPLRELEAWPPVREWLGTTGMGSLTLQGLLGWILTPLTWLMGVPWDDAASAGRLQGERLIVNEFLAYSTLGQMMHDPAGPRISERGAQLMTYALCGFANFASIGIQIGGLTPLAPNQRRTIVTLAFKTMLAGALAGWMTAAVASLVI